MIAAAADLGSTRLKSGLLDAEGRLSVHDSRPTPALRGEGMIREGDGEAYVDSACELLDGLSRRLPAGSRLGLATQRSSFLLWDRQSGRATSPLISWQDRRAAAWCARNVGLAERVRETTGLVLSAHYVGPKLAALAETSGEWRDRLRAGSSCFGTLDCFLIWRLTGGEIHEIDRTMAARTAMLDLATGDWSDELLSRFGVRRELLPRVTTTRRAGLGLTNGLCVTATIADQAAGVIALVDRDSTDLLLNVGTGTFAMRNADGHAERIRGYLTAPVLGLEGGRTDHVIEGAINGGGALLDRFGPGPTTLPESDPLPDAFCLPDAAGLATPYWRPEIGASFSETARRLDGPGRRRVALEGLLFRIRQVVDGMCRPGNRGRILLAGGVAREESLCRGLAKLLDAPIERLEVAEAGLVGTARLAAGLPPYASPETRRFDPDASGDYLTAKYDRWCEFVTERLGK